jgi:cytochrome c
MKKIMLPLAFVLFAIACGSNEEKKTETTTNTTTEAVEEPTTDLSANPDYTKGLALVGKSDCLTCHKVNEASTGPAYKDVAAKYSNAADTTIERLANTIIKGGSGNWGSIPMTPHPTVSLDDAKQMVKYVLLLNK